MKRHGLSLGLVGVCALLLAVMAGCPSPLASTAGGSLAIQFTNNINAKTLLPGIDMHASSYDVRGTGPGGATFSETSGGDPVTIGNLAFGSWTVTVDALNAAGTVIGSGQDAAVVHTGETTVVAITVVPLGGDGTLSLTVTWTASQVDTPSIQASLTSPLGGDTSLSFTISGSQATWSGTLSSGYRTLTVQLLDGGILVAGAVEVVRIVSGQTTSGTYAFANVNQAHGSVQVNITPEMAEPIPVSISGMSSTIIAGTSVTATASAGDGTGGVVYVWYLNGVSQGTGASFTLGGTLAPGWYRLDVTGFTADGKRGGSASLDLTVLVDSEGAVLLPKYPVDYDVDSQGRVFAVSYDYDLHRLIAYLVRRDGAYVASDVLVDHVDYPDIANGLAQVNSSPQGNRTLVTWLTDVGGDNTHRRILSRLFDANAAAVTPVFPWPSPVSGNYIFDAAIDDSGSFVVLWLDLYDQTRGWRAFLSAYDSQGNKQGDDILVDDTQKFDPSFGMHVVLNPSDGSGIITTQGHFWSPVYYRRFDSSHQFVDTAFQPVPYSDGNNSSWYESHVAGMNRDGDFVIQWASFRQGDFEACFFNAAGALQAHVVLGTQGSFRADGFRFRHQKIECLGGNFILRGDRAPYSLWLYSPAGVLLGTTATDDDAVRLRTNYGPTTWIPGQGYFDIKYSSLRFD